MNLPIFERYAEQKILPTGSSVLALLRHYAPGHHIGDTERVGLPETSDPLNIAGEQAEKVVVNNVRKRRLGEKLKFGKKREKTKRMSDGGREFKDNYDNTDAEQDAGTEPAQIARQRSLVGFPLTYNYETEYASGASTPSAYLSFDDPYNPDCPRIQSFGGQAGRVRQREARRLFLRERVS
ncbi:hypothetical protein E4T56_gene13206 [Termitomyces sp. T112]|nr:hypothetical protein E4T56_gene13206 [Termitomyces sp. T112]